MVDDDQHACCRSRVRGNIVRALLARGQPVSSGEIRRTLSARDRPEFEAAVSDLVGWGSVEKIPRPGRRTPLLRYRLTDVPPEQLARPVTPDARGRISLRHALSRAGRRGVEAGAYAVDVDDRGVITLTPVTWTTKGERS